MSTIYINGDAAEYTGETMELDGGLFYEVRMIEGRNVGKTKVTQRAPGEAPPVKRVELYKGRVPQAPW